MKPSSSVRSAKPGKSQPEIQRPATKPVKLDIKTIRNAVRVTLEKHAAKG